MAIPESDYLEAFKTAGRHLQTCMDASDAASFGWIKMRPSKPAFADLVFTAGQRMYAVLLVSMASQKKAEGGSGLSVQFDIPREQHELLLQECERYRLEPVVFPLWLGIMQPLTTGWNLFSLNTMEPVTPGAEPDIPPVPMSEWELCNFCVGQVVKELEEKSLRIYACQDLPDIYPHIWFTDEDNRRAWVAALPTFGTEPERIPNEVKDLRHKLPNGVAGYIARMGVSSAERPGAHPLRGEGLFVRYKGLEKLP